MAKISVYYTPHEIHGFLVPIRLHIFFGREVILWHKEKIYIPIKFPFTKMTADDHFPEVTSVTVMAGDLFRHPVRDEQFGIYIPFLVQRIQEDKERTGGKYELKNIEQFIIQVHDIESVLFRKLTHLYDDDDF